MTLRSIAIIGAGVAGLACARRLTHPDVVVKLYDKSRSVGGRLATRRVTLGAGELRFDHGAQYLTAHDSAFQGVVDALLSSGAVAAWTAPLTHLAAGAMRVDLDGARFVGAPGMNAAAKALAVGLDVTPNARVVALQRDPSGWRLGFADDTTAGPFDAVVVATPAEQGVALLEDAAPALASQAAAARTAPCWAGLFAFDQTPHPHIEALSLADHPVLAWIAHDSAKPGRNATASCWVAHAREEWSRAHLDAAPDDAAAILRDAVCEILMTSRRPIYAAAHRWRYARVERAAANAHAFDPELRIGVCGDWRIGARVEAAWLSGASLGAAMTS